MKNPFRPAKFWPALGYAALAGSRATFAPAFVSRYLSRQLVNPRLIGSPFRYLAKPGVTIGLELLTLAEIAGDKMPKAPNRIVPQQLGTRAAAGALAAAALYKSKGGSPWLGALVGVAGTVAATYATFWLRKQATDALHGNAVLSGFGEDALAAAGGLALSRK